MLLALHVNGTTFCFEYEGYGEPVSVWVMDNSMAGEGTTVTEAARDLCAKLGIAAAWVRTTATGKPGTGESE